MRLATHRITEETFLEVARGGGGATAVRQIAVGRHSRDLVLLRTLVDWASSCAHPDAAAARAAYRSLANIERHAPDAVRTVIHYPLVSSWVLSTVMQLRSDQWAAARPGFLAAVAAAAAVRGAVPIDLDLSVAVQTGCRITLPSLGTAILPDSWHGSVELRCGRAGAELFTGGRRIGIHVDSHQTVDGWRGLPLISAECEGQRIDLLLDILEPEDETSPVAAGHELCDPQALDAWRVQMTDGWRLMVRHHREAAAEFAAVVTVLAPLAADPGGYVSATASDAFGCIAMSRPPDAVTAALTLAHEIQHVKLTAIMDLFPLVEAGPDDRFYAPWRDDPRPAAGLLHGAYAHLGVAGFWRRQRHHMAGFGVLHAHTEFARWRAAALDVSQFLATSECLTPLGRRFVQGMLTTLSEWIYEEIPDEAAGAAERLSRAHRAAWCAAHGDPGR